MRSGTGWRKELGQARSQLIWGRLKKPVFPVKGSMAQGTSGIQLPTLSLCRLSNVENFRSKPNRQRDRDGFPCCVEMELEQACHGDARSSAELGES